MLTENIPLEGKSSYCSTSTVNEMMLKEVSENICMLYNSLEVDDAPTDLVHPPRVRAPPSASIISEDTHAERGL